jgi:hypothetical protein
MNTTAKYDPARDRRRYGVVEVRFRRVGGMSMYDLTINGELWACVEWSPSRRAWCIQDASGRCLAHLDAIHGEDVDAQTALALARRMILDGSMPTPEVAAAQLRERLAAEDAPSPADAEADDRRIDDIAAQLEEQQQKRLADDWADLEEALLPIGRRSHA